MINSGNFGFENFAQSEINHSDLSYTQAKVGRPEFKGSLEDLVMITNFKRFKRKGSSSRYKGVFYVKKEKKFRAQICLKGKKKYVGTFKNDRDAAFARDKKIREMFGEVEELLNFPLSKQHLDGAAGDQSAATNDPSSLLSNVEPHLKSAGGQSGADNLVTFVPTPNPVSTFHGYSDQVSSVSPRDDLERMRNRLINRYSSGGSSLNVPLGFGNSNNDETQNAPQAFVDSQNFINSQLGYRGFSEGANLTSNGQQQLFPGNYNSLVNFNLHEIAIPKSRTMLTKRFSSNDSCATAFTLSMQPTDAFSTAFGNTGGAQICNGLQNQRPDGSTVEPDIKRMKTA